jgi:hypothetical protein
LVGFGVSRKLNSSKERSARLVGGTLMNLAELYRVETGSFPVRLEELVPRHMKELPADPWGRPYALYRGEGGIAIVSAGNDGELGTNDDLVTVLPPVEPCPRTCANEPPSDGTMEALGCPEPGPARGGFQISHLRPGVLTEAGIRKGDVVTHINGQSMATPEEGLDAYYKLQAAKRFEIELIRGAQRIQVVVDRAWAKARIRKP